MQSVLGHDVQDADGRVSSRDCQLLLQRTEVQRENASIQSSHRADDCIVLRRIEHLPQQQQQE
jgi:hypothetical protein